VTTSVLEEQRDRDIAHLKVDVAYLQSTQLANAAREQQLRHQLELVSTRVDRIDAKVDKLAIDVDKRFDAVDKRFDAMDRRFDAMDKRFDCFETHVKERFDVMESKLDEVHTMMGQVRDYFEERRRAGEES
jgi:septal ring factor EnvC (AmiA/AmiB activator)